MPKVTSQQAPVGKTYLRAWREYRKLSQEKVAIEIGISRSHISKIENGKEPYNQNFLEAVAAVYQCRVTDLLSHDPRRDIPLWHIVEELQTADKSVRDTAADVLRVLLKQGG